MLFSGNGATKVINDDSMNKNTAGQALSTGTNLGTAGSGSVGASKLCCPGGNPAYNCENVPSSSGCPVGYSVPSDK